MRYLDNNYWAKTRKEALEAAKTCKGRIHGTSLPAPGYAWRVTVEGREYWLTRTIFFGQQLWALHLIRKGSN